MKRILFVDDESNVLDGIRRMLHADRRRWDMHFAVGGEAALRACEARKFDVVVSDMRMPGMDGATLLGHIRDRYPETARLILSGYSEVALTTRAIAVAYRVISKPCKGPDLQAVIERVCSLQDLLCAPGIRSVIGTIGELPSLSSTYAELSWAVRQPSSTVAEVAGIIQKDVAMSAKILQLVNSGFFGLAQTVTNLDNAVAYLGLNTIADLALASEVFTVFTPDTYIPSSLCERIQFHARRAALIAGTLPLEATLRESAILGALLHDIGALALAKKMPNQFASVLALMNERGCAQFQAEEEILGISHAEIGAYLLGLWGINSVVVEAIAHHHRPTRVLHHGLDTSASVYLATLLSHEIDANPTDLEGLTLREFDRDCLIQMELMDQFPKLRATAAESIC